MSSNEFQARSSLSITFSVWRALLLREALSRITGGRVLWLWLLLEPVSHIAFLTFVMTVIRHRVVGGIDAVLWVVSGLIAFFFFRRTTNQSVSAVNANSALFAYRQVRPVDTVLVRAFLEGGLMLLVSLIVFLSAAFLGIDVWPNDPMYVFGAVASLWLFGLGIGLIFSVATELIPEIERVFKFVMMPVYLVSGVIFPIAAVPMPYRDWLLLNPIVHGLEATRLGFAPYYHAVPELDLSYLATCALVCLFFGLALHQRFVQRLIAK